MSDKKWVYRFEELDAAEAYSPVAAAVQAMRLWLRASSASPLLSAS